MTKEMPVFVIKAKDNFSLRTLSAYHLFCVEAGLVAQAIEVTKAMVEMYNWRRDNSELLQFPDHKHVPVGE